MEREIKFSRDQKAFRDSEAATPAAAIEASIKTPEDALDYLSEVHVSMQKDQTYRILVGIRNEIDDSYGKIEGFGQAFLDGGAIELNIINEFAPQLKNGLYQSILTHVNKQSIAHFVHERDAHFITDEQQRRFVESVLPPRHRRKPRLSEDEVSLLHAINAAQAAHEHHFDALLDGFTFVRTYAHRANEADYSNLAQQAFNLYSKPGNSAARLALDHELWDFLADEGTL